ncbi:unnamed protein product [Acanthoscelides obtectus]|uniref:CRAL-TRIO domain-containing protein n=2 Tax=Acanthoscelides obtectus TaxID=200917 RepID=A0A9P0PGE0_ACAOB|nr:unnamed protein product [Acanthoscelides obtectus]CAK1645674.1 Alpha-tocopherol transfer protein-like [Acanthoscelides obtectus]
MPFKEIDVDTVYKGDPQLKKEDIKNLKEWAEMQPHLPKMTELQLILFLQSCYYSNELAKTTIDIYFTVKTLCPDIFANRSIKDPAVKLAATTMLASILPKRTPNGDTVIFFKLMDNNPDNFNFALQIRCFDMITLSHHHREGPQNGITILFDMQGIVFGHFLKLSVVIMKKLLYYLQEGMPIRLKSLQYFNIPSFMDKILALMKPFMKKELYDSIQIHTTMESLYAQVPKDILPQEYGGSCESLKNLHDKFLKLMAESEDLFKFQETQLADESKRPGKPKSISDVFGMEGTFKKLEVD